MIAQLQARLTKAGAVDKAIVDAFADLAATAASLTVTKATRTTKAA
jgi:hypothetical protein